MQTGQLKGQCNTGTGNACASSTFFGLPIFRGKLPIPAFDPLLMSLQYIYVTQEGDHTAGLTVWLSSTHHKEDFIGD